MVDTLDMGDGPVSVFKHRGEWTEESVTAYATSTPCIAIAYAGSTDFGDNADGSTEGWVAFTAFCITEEADGDEDDASLALTTMLLAVVPGNQWGMSGNFVAGAVDVDGVNEYSHKLDDKGVNIHAVSWMHRVTLPKLTAAEYAALPDFLSLFTSAHPGTEIPSVFDPQEDFNEVREP